MLFYIDFKNNFIKIIPKIYFYLRDENRRVRFRVYILRLERSIQAKVELAAVVLTSLSVDLISFQIADLNYSFLLHYLALYDCLSFSMSSLVYLHFEFDYISVG